MTCTYNSLIEINGLVNGTSSCLFCKSGNISEMVQHRNVVTTGR